MKRLNIFVFVLSAIIIVVNTFLFFTLTNRIESMNSKLDRLEMQLARVQGSSGNSNIVTANTEVKEKEVFTPSELARYLGVEMSKIYDLIDAEGIGLPYVCIDGEYRFGKEAIDEWLKTNINMQTRN